MISLTRFSSPVSHLIVLAYCDSIMLAGNMYCVAIPTWLKLNHADLRIYHNAYLTAIWSIVYTCCIYLVVLVSLERYMMLCQHEKAKRFCTLTKIQLYIIGIIVFSLGFNFPIFFATEWVTLPSNETKFLRTDFSCTWTYQVVYRTSLNLIFRQIVPLFCIVKTNYHLMFKVCLKLNSTIS